jgi:threonine dehydrogenase-like Zn-dependent dehydrogenase
MRAISCSEPGKLTFVDIDKPELKPGWVRVGIRHIGICGTDYHIFEGTHPFLQYPRIMGHELSGVVLDANGSNFADGDPVVINSISELRDTAPPASRASRTAARR